MTAQQLNTKQKLLLEYLISDRDSFVKCIRIMKPSYFETPLDRVCECVVEYFSKYHNAPSVDQIEAETGVVLKERTLEDDERSYFLEEFEQLCRDSAMEAAILQSVEYLQNGMNSSIPDLVRKALLVRIDDKVGTDLFENPKERIEGMAKNVDERCIGIQELDNLISKIRRGELGMFFAETGGGKSVSIANVAWRLAKQGLDSFIISIELNEELYSKRMDAIVSNTNIAFHSEKAEEISRILSEQSATMGRIVTKKVPFGTTHEEIRSYVMEYHLKYGKYPDALFVDYLGIMGAGGKKFSNKSEEDEVKAFGIRDICVDFDMYGFSAGQINREGYDVKSLGPQHIAGGISVINASDWAVGLVASEEDIENNQVQGIQMKVRNGGKTKKPIILYRCPKTLRISDRPFTSQQEKKNVVEEEKKDNPKPTGKDKLRELIKKR